MGGEDWLRKPVFNREFSFAKLGAVEEMGEEEASTSGETRPGDNRILKGEALPFSKGLPPLIKPCLSKEAISPFLKASTPLCTSPDLVFLDSNLLPTASWGGSAVLDFGTFSTVLRVDVCEGSLLSSLDLRGRYEGVLGEEGREGVRAIQHHEPSEFTVSTTLRGLGVCPFAAGEAARLRAGEVAAMKA